MVSALRRSWATVGDQRSLAERWDEASRKLTKLGGTMTFGPMSETTLLDLQEEIARLTPAPAWDPALAAASHELYNAAHRYWRSATAIKESQKKLARLRESGEHRILGDITAEMFEEPLAPQKLIDGLFGPVRKNNPSPFGLCLPEFRSASDYRAAERELTAHAQALEDVARRMDAVFGYESIARPDQNRALILSLAERLDALAARVGQLANQINLIASAEAGRQSTTIVNQRRTRRK